MEWIEQLQYVKLVSDQPAARLAAYLLGCFTSGYYLVRARIGKDIREIQSGSVGARNVGRVLGKSGFIVTLLCDSGKGGGGGLARARHGQITAISTLLAMLAVVCRAYLADATSFSRRQRRGNISGGIAGF